MKIQDIIQQSAKLDEACWKGYHKEGNKKMFGKTYPNCVKNKNESLETYVNRGECPGCGGHMVHEDQLNEKQDACYHKVKSRYKVWPSAYASGALVQCRKKGAANWGNSNESITQEEYDQLDENLKKWFDDKWVRFGPDGKIKGDCARGDDSEGKPKCLPQSKAHSLGKKGRASSAAKKRREDPDADRSGKAKNVATKVNESVVEGWKDEADDFTEWSNHVKEKLSKASPEQRLGLAKQLSQLEVKHFGSTVPNTFNRQTGKAQAGLGLTDTVRNALKYFDAEQTGIRQYYDQDLPSGTFGDKFGSVTIDGMENATPAELALMAKAVRAGADYAKAAGRIYRETGTITQQDLDKIRKDFEDNANKFAASIGAQMDYSNRPEETTALAQASLDRRDKAVAEGMERAVDAKDRTQSQWLALVKAKFPDAKIIQAKMIDGPVQATLSDGRKLSWSKVEQQGVSEAMLEETYDGDEFFEAYGELWYNEDEQLDEAEYQGRSVQLGKPMQGDVKKFKVYVKDPSTGNVKKVNFGDPNMRIKKSNPARRRSFRARHNCDNPGPRTSARYWSCRKW